MKIEDKDTVRLTADKEKVGTCLGSVLDLDGIELFIVRCPGKEYFVGTYKTITLVAKFGVEHFQARVVTPHPE